MFTNIFSQKYIAAVLFGVVVCFGAVFAPLHSANAYDPYVPSVSSQPTSEELTAIINALLAQITALQEQLRERQSHVTQSLSVGDHVVTTDNLKLRMSPNASGQVFYILPEGSGGEIVTSQSEGYSNPTHANGYTWWRVRFESLGVTGWVAGDWLKLAEEDRDDHDIFVEFLDDDVDDEGEYGEFEIEFEVTATDDDVYIPTGVAINEGSSKTGFVANFINSDGSVEDDGEMTVVVTSSADEDNGYYEIDEGETEEFTLYATLEPERTGYYRLQLEEVRYTHSPVSGYSNVYVVDDIDTEKLYINVGDDDDYDGELQLVSVKELSVDNDGNTVTYEFGYLLEADDGDVKIPLTAGLWSLQEDRGIWYRIEPKDPEILNYGKKTVSVSGSNEVDGYLVIEDGDTETLYLEVEYAPVKSGDYRGRGDTIRYNDGQELELDASKNRTSFAYVKGSEVSCPIYMPPLCENGDLVSKGKDSNGCSLGYECVVSEAPEKNNYACDRAGVTTNSDVVSCYGVWDYGSDFGGDQDMCGSYGAGKTGCEIDAKICLSGQAKATKYLTVNSMSDSKLAEVVKNLSTTESAVREGIAGLWEYNCITVDYEDTNDYVRGASISIGDRFAQSAALLSAIEDSLRKILGGLK